MRQINYTFGQTLEFSCTVEGDRIVSQEIVSSGPDALFSLKLDKGQYLGPDSLESLSGQIRAAQSSGVQKATDQEADAYMSRAKEFLSGHPVFKDVDPGMAYILAEHMAAKDYKTLYDSAVTYVPIVERPLYELDGVEHDDYDEDEEEEWDEYDEYDDEDWGDDDDDEEDNW